MWHPYAAVFLIASVTATCGFTNPYPKYEDYKTEEGTAYPSPLILTPYIESGRIKQARRLSEVSHKELQGGFRSYAGYFTVEPQFVGNLFFWFFPNRDPKAPVLLWLEGGPGASSLFGLFQLNGPFVVREGRVKTRQFAWTKTHSVLYIDNPIGAGYSFAERGFATNETTIGKDLYNALVQFFTVFSEYQKNEFYISGESYAGKYVPALGYQIYQNNRNAKIKINLQGLAIGNGWTDPINQYQYAEYFYQIGLLDRRGADVFQKYQTKGVNYIKAKQWSKAYDTFESIFDGNSSLFRNLTGFSSYYNLLYAGKFNIDDASFVRFVQRLDVRKAIHVGNVDFGGNYSKVAESLKEDVYQSVAGWVSELLSNYRVLIYTGQIDLIVPYPLTENYLSQLNFTGAAVYRNATRYQWRLGSELVGYVKHAGNLTDVLVRNAGHFVPADQPLVALDLITRFTHRKSFV